MTQHIIKRSKTNVTRAAVGIIGPVDQYGTAQAGAKWQELNFKGPNGNLAIADLTPGDLYKVGLDIWGAKGGTLLLERSVSAAGPFAAITTFTIPQNVSGPKTQFGFYHWDTFIFQA